MNLKDETLALLTKRGYNALTDVAWVGGQNGKLVIPWAAFVLLADKVYDNGFGGREVAHDLVVVLKDGCWLSRAEYDGSEWWRFNKCPKLSVKAENRTDVDLFGRSYNELGEE